jgi:hypothetical protein
MNSERQPATRTRWNVSIDTLAQRQESTDARIPTVNEQAATWWPLQVSESIGSFSLVRSRLPQSATRGEW